MPQPPRSPVLNVASFAACRVGKLTCHPERARFLREKGPGRPARLALFWWRTTRALGSAARLQIRMPHFWFSLPEVGIFVCRDTACLSEEALRPYTKSNVPSCNANNDRDGASARPGRSVLIVVVPILLIVPALLVCVPPLGVFVPAPFTSALQILTRVIGLRAVGRRWHRAPCDWH